MAPETVYRTFFLVGLALLLVSPFVPETSTSTDWFLIGSGALVLATGWLGIRRYRGNQTKGKFALVLVLLGETLMIFVFVVNIFKITFSNSPFSDRAHYGPIITAAAIGIAMIMSSVVMRYNHNKKKILEDL